MDLLAGLARLFFFALNMVVIYSSEPIAMFMCPPTPSLLLQCRCRCHGHGRGHDDRPYYHGQLVIFYERRSSTTSSPT